MKRILLTALLGLFAVTAASAQTTVDSGHSSIEVAVKRAFASGSDVCIDLIITSRGNWDKIVLHGDSEFYDDEGSRYTSGIHYRDYGVYFERDNERMGGACQLNIVKDIPRKLRIIVKNVDEYASSFLLIKLPYLGNNTTLNSCTMTIKNLPITRN